MMGEFICAGWDGCHFGLMWNVPDDPQLQAMGFESVEQLVERHEFIWHGLEAA